MEEVIASPTYDSADIMYGNTGEVAYTLNLASGDLPLLAPSHLALHTTSAVIPAASTSR